MLSISRDIKSGMEKAKRSLLVIGTAAIETRDLIGTGRAVTALGGAWKRLIYKRGWMGEGGGA